MRMNRQTGCISLICFMCAVAHGGQGKDRSLYDMSLGELRHVRFVSSASLLDMEKRKIPASMTVITREMIEHSGARSLDELLIIFVPGFQSIRHPAWSRELALRTNTGTDKFILLVNGKKMNALQNFGPMSERFISMLTDIETIEVIRGPGGALYGPGAVSGIISITTRRPEDMKEGEITVRGGSGEAFGSIAFNLPYRINANSLVHLYYGIDTYRGSNPDESPYFYSYPFSPPDIGSGTPTTHGLSHNHGAFRNLPRHKVHLQLDSGDLTSWFRWTKGGETSFSNVSEILNGGGDLGDGTEWGSGYQQFTLQNNYLHECSEKLTVEVEAGYMAMDLVVLRPNVTQRNLPGRESFESSREDRLTTEATATWRLNDDHNLAFGGGASREAYGLKTMGFPDDPARLSAIGTTDDWHINTYSLFAEYQWSASEYWTTILAGRMDKHSYTKYLWSPKVAFIYTPTERDTWKLMYNRAVRINNAPELLRVHRIGSSGEYEPTDLLELIYQRDLSEELELHLSAYCGSQRVIAWSSVESRLLPFGDYEHAGMELELQYRSVDWLVLFSHNYSKLLQFDLDDPSKLQHLTAAPYGYGDDFQRVAPHNSKLYLSYQASARLNLNSSLVIQWAFPGSADMADWNNATAQDPNYPRTDGSTHAFRGNYYLNAGAKYDLNDAATLGLNLHNVLGWVDESLNKLNYLRSTEYRIEAPSVSGTFTYRF